MKVVFWDFDGTLVYSNPLWSGSVYKALKDTDSGTKICFEDIRKHMAYGFINVVLSNNYPELRDILYKLGLFEFFDKRLIKS